MIRRALAFVCVLFFAVSAHAQVGVNIVPQVNITFSGATVGTTHGQVLAATQSYVYVMLHNPSQSGGNTIWCSWGGTATVGGAGTLSIAPGQYLTFESSGVPNSALDCIASGASTPMTVGTR